MMRSLQPLKTMWRNIGIVIILIVFTSFLLVEKADFLTKQKQYERVKIAYAEKGKSIDETLTKYKLHKNNFHLLLVAYKNEKQLDLYVKNKEEKLYKKIKTYSVCAASGVLGPKRRAGDGQVPEGFYYIDRFNPASSYYLSLGLNYPNSSDKKKSKAKDLGGDIFIHGECVTIGCLPMTNDKIKEIYLYAIQAKHNGQLKIPVYVFPYKMTEQNTLSFSSKYKHQPELLQFWKNIKGGYDQFIAKPQELRVQTDADGNYQYQ